MCKRKLDSKCQALLILSKELDQCRSERDQFKLMAEQLQQRYQNIKRQLGQVYSTLSYDCLCFFFLLVNQIHLVGTKMYEAVENL